MPVGDIYVWQVRSFTVRLSLPMVDRLRSALARMPANEEHGGILLGSIVDPLTVEVTGCEFFPSAHRKGTLYDLGAHERERVAMRARELARVKTMRPVGYFRTHQRPGLFLDQDDFALMEDAFREPGSAALLIRPQPGGPPDAGFFFWENGGLDRKQTQLVFPFDSEALRTRGPLVSRTHAQAPGRNAEMLPAAFTPYRAALLWAGAALLSFGLVALLFKAGESNPQASANPFDLRIARNGESLMVDWNRDAPVLRNVLSASLSIDDGGVVQKVTLDRAELEHGSVQFWPQSARVVVRMDVTSSREISESVTAVVEGGGGETAWNRKPAPMPPAGNAMSLTNVGNPVPQPASPLNPAPEVAGQAGNGSEESSTRAFQPKTRAWHAAEIPPNTAGRSDTDTDPGSALQAAVSSSAKPLATPAPETTPPVKPASPPVVTRTEHVVTVAVQLEPRLPSEMHRVINHIPLIGHVRGLRYHGGESDFRPPQPEHLIEARVPEYMADYLKAPVDIAVLVSIDKKGKVKDTEVLEGAGTGFGSLAADRAAAIEWQPGRVGDKPVASQVVAHFHFRRVEKEVAEAQPRAAGNNK